MNQSSAKQTIAPLVEIIDNKMRLNLHPGQTRAWESKARFVFIIAGTQSGKTSFLPHLFYRWIRELGPGDYIAATATYDLFKLKFLPEMLRVFCEWTHWGRYVASDRLIVSHDGTTRIILRSANSPGGLESATINAALLDECGQPDFTLEAWEAIQRRLALTRGRVLAGTTPYNLGWLKEVFDRWQNGDPEYDVIQFSSLDNPAFPREEYERMRLSLPSWKFEMFYNGNFVKPAGLVYNDFDPQVHVVTLPVIAPTWRIYVGVDFGAVHTAQVWLAEQPGTGNLYIFRESLLGGRSSVEHATMAKMHAQSYHHVKWYGGSPSESQARMDWAQAGVPIHCPPISDVDAQIDRITHLLRTRRLFIGRGLSRLINEISTYSRELDEHGQPTEKIAHKSDFHCLDALRYAIAGATMRTLRARSLEY